MTKPWIKAEFTVYPDDLGPALATLTTRPDGYVDVFVPKATLTPDMADMIGEAFQLASETAALVKP